MSQREQQLERELSAARSIVRALHAGRWRQAYELENTLDYMQQQRAALAAVLKWRPHDE